MASVSYTHLDVYKRQGLLKLDVVGYLDITQADGMRTALSEHIGQDSGRFKVGGYKTFLDGSPQARTAWLREPYCGAEENYRGYPGFLR